MSTDNVFSLGFGLDGPTADPLASGNAVDWSPQSIGMPGFNVPSLYGDDAREAAQMQPFSPDPSRPWWEATIQYGLTRAIDNRFGPSNVQGNTDAGTFGGANGRTYQQRPGGTATGASSSSSGLLPLLIVGAVAYAALA